MEETTWTVQWSVRLRDSSASPRRSGREEIVDADLVARMNRDSIRLQLQDATGTPIKERNLEASSSTKRTSRGVVVDWTSADDRRRILARLLFTEDGEPVLRTSLPGLLGILGGRHDLARIAADEGPAVAGRISGDS